MTLPHRRATAVLVLAASAPLLLGCSAEVSIGGAKAVSADELERSIASNITVDGESGTDTGIDIVCDDDLPAKVDATVDCFGTDPDGATTGFRPTVTSVDGTDVEFDSPLFLTGDEVAGQVGAGLEEQGYVLTSLECEEAIGEVGSTSGCTAQVDGADEPDELLVTVNEVDGLRFRIGYEVAG